VFLGPETKKWERKNLSLRGRILETVNREMKNAD
jgi:hypothetical protein